MSLDNKIELSQTPKKPEKKSFWRRTSTQVTGGGLALLGAGIGLALSVGGGKTGTNPSPTDHPTASASATPGEVSPTIGAHEYPRNPITDRVPTVFELTEPLPASMDYLNTIDADTGFVALSLQDKLKYLSWIDQRQADYNNRFTKINIDVPEAANLNSAPSPNDSAILIEQRFSQIANSSLSFADWASGQNPPPIDLNEAKKIIYALYDGTPSDFPELGVAISSLENTDHSLDVDTLASSSHGVIDEKDIVSKSEPYETTDGYQAVDITLHSAVDGSLFVKTYIFVPFEDFRGNPQVGVVLRSVKPVS